MNTSMRHSQDEIRKNAERAYGIVYQICPVNNLFYAPIRQHINGLLRELSTELMLSIEAVDKSILAMKVNDVDEPEIKGDSFALPKGRNAERLFLNDFTRIYSKIVKNKMSNNKTKTIMNREKKSKLTTSTKVNQSELIQVIAEAIEEIAKAETGLSKMMRLGRVDLPGLIKRLANGIITDCEIGNGIIVIHTKDTSFTLQIREEDLSTRIKDCISLVFIFFLDEMSNTDNYTDKHVSTEHTHVLKNGAKITVESNTIESLQEDVYNIEVGNAEEKMYNVLVQDLNKRQMSQRVLGILNSCARMAGAKTRKDLSTLIGYLTPKNRTMLRKYYDLGGHIIPNNLISKKKRLNTNKI